MFKFLRGSKAKAEAHSPYKTTQQSLQETYVEENIEAHTQEAMAEISEY